MTFEIWSFFFHKVYLENVNKIVHMIHHCIHHSILFWTVFMICIDGCFNDGTVSLKWVTVRGSSEARGSQDKQPWLVYSEAYRTENDRRFESRDWCTLTSDFHVCIWKGSLKTFCEHSWLSVTIKSSTDERRTWRNLEWVSLEFSPELRAIFSTDTDSSDW